ncbi:MAG: DEAD/DEAH box helicase [Gammaproteobacteria bacterium]|nr:DEAD/DEAH box helicase [Gammaproteobacteria bacterium]
MTTSEPITAFHQLQLLPQLLKVLDEVGYETPSPIQAETIPLLLEGRDLVGQAQTGTGKTAAFALPLLSRLDLKLRRPQVLVLVPTRELAIQVAEAFQKYATYLQGFHVLPIYGGQDYRGQLRSLERGVHVVVGTPGRVIDHIRRGTLKLDHLQTLALDEADEMLRMGFIDDVEWVMQQAPEERQILLFSATMPQQIRRIAQQYLRDPAQVTIKVKTTTAETIRQRYWLVSGYHKLDALTRILEAEPFEAMLIFVRTKTATLELAEKLEARGYAVAPLNGDIPQQQRERTVEQLKKGKIDIVVATDVAARGLDVQRISHVLNYDIPYDTEAYVHRIGRTGRAGREGDAILFVAPRERRLLLAIEKATRKKIDLMELPSTETINDQRISRFKQKISDILATEELGFYYQIIEQFQKEHNTPALEVAAALAHLLQGDTPFLLQQQVEPRQGAAKAPRGRSEPAPPPAEGRRARSDKRETLEPLQKGMERYRLAVGSRDEVKPGNIVGAIANEAGIEGKYIGRVAIFEEYTLVDLPEGMPKEIFNDLKKARVAGKPLNITLDGGGAGAREATPEKEEAKGIPKKRTKPKPKKRKKILPPTAQ